MRSLSLSILFLKATPSSSCINKNHTSLPFPHGPGTLSHCSIIFILLSFVAFLPHVQAISILSYTGRTEQGVMEERQHRVVWLEGGLVPVKRICGP